MTSIDKFQGALAGAVDQGAILKALNLNPSDPKTQALLLVCDRYGLDPLLKHMVLISGNPYVTRDGYLAVAHRSGVFDGMEVLAQSSDQTHFVAKVAVFRKDMSHPFTFVGRFPKSKQMAKEYGPEMAVKVAEVQALRRAFNVTGVPAADERWDVDDREVQVAVAPAGVDRATGEITGGGEVGSGHSAPPPVSATVVSAPASAVRRPPPGAAKPVEATATVVAPADGDPSFFAGDGDPSFFARTEADPEPDVTQPGGWNAETWRSFLTAHGVKQAELLREANRLCGMDGAPFGVAPSKLADLVGRADLCGLLVGFVLDKADQS